MELRLTDKYRETLKFGDYVHVEPMTSLFKIHRMIVAYDGSLVYVDTNGDTVPASQARKATPEEIYIHKQRESGLKVGDEEKEDLSKYRLKFLDELDKNFISEEYLKRYKQVEGSILTTYEVASLLATVHSTLINFELFYLIVKKYMITKIRVNEDFILYPELGRFRCIHDSSIKTPFGVFEEKEEIHDSKNALVEYSRSIAQKQIDHIRKLFG